MRINTRPASTPLILFFVYCAMARSLPQHKQNFAGFVVPNYAAVAEVNSWEIGQRFQRFMDECMAQIPDEGAPADGYMYNTHMGQFARSLDEAKDHFVKGSLAFYAKRGSGAVPKTDAQ